MTWLKSNNINRETNTRISQGRGCNTQGLDMVSVGAQWVKMFMMALSCFLTGYMNGYMNKMTDYVILNVKMSL